MSRIESDLDLTHLRVLVEYSGQSVVDFDGQAWHVQIDIKRPVYDATRPEDTARRWQPTGERIIGISFRPADAPPLP